MVPSSTVENYLKAIYQGQLVLGAGERLVSMGQVAASLGVTPGTATTMVKALAESGLAEYEPYSGVRLSAAGEKLAGLVLRRHRLVELFLVQVMGMSWAEVHDEAEQLEHVVSERLIERIDEMLGRPTHDPHGDPIPTPEGDIPSLHFDSLLTCPIGAPLRVARIADQDPAFLRFIERNDLKPGEAIEVETRDDAADAVTVRGKNRRMVVIGARAASKLLVELVTPVLLMLLMFAAAAAAQAGPAADNPAAPSPSTATSTALANKLTVAYYDFSSGTVGADINLRHTFQSSTAWVGGYHQDDGFDQVRAGYEYDYHHDWLTLTPSVQAATHGFAGATIYGEVGHALFGIAGAGRTNLKPYWNLGFDPNDYVQFGVGYHDQAGNTRSIYTIHDNRLDTGQTNTHLVFRQYLPAHWRLTFDVVNEHGHGDEGLAINVWAGSLDVDWRQWFVRAAADPHVNYTADRQVRVAAGVRF